MAKKKAGKAKAGKKQLGVTQTEGDNPIQTLGADEPTSQISPEEAERDLHPHVDWGLKVLYRATAIRALRTFERETMFLSSYAYRAVIRDLRLNLQAIPDPEDPVLTLVPEHPNRKIIEDYLEHFLQKVLSGGGGDSEPEDPNILQGP